MHVNLFEFLGKSGNNLRKNLKLVSTCFQTKVKIIFESKSVHTCQIITQG